MNNSFIHPIKYELCHCGSICQDSTQRQWLVFYCYQEMETKKAILAISNRKLGDHCWGNTKILADVEGYSLGNPIIWEVAPQQFVIMYSVIDSGYWDSASLRVIQMDANLKTSSPTKINTPSGHLVRHPPIRAFDGTYILPIYDEVEKTSYLAKNTNDQFSLWESIYEFPDKNIIQGQLLRLTDRSLVIFFRPMGKRASIFMSRSQDDGYSWTPIKDTQLSCPQSGISACTDGHEVYLVYNNTKEHQRFPLSFTRSISPFSSWSDPSPIDQMRFEVSYPQFFVNDRHLQGVYTYNRKMIKSVDIDLDQVTTIAPSISGIASFKDRHKGKSVFILASGPSLETLDLSPLDRRIVIGLNRSFMKYANTYYHCMFDQRLFELYEDKLKDHRCLFTLEGRPWGVELKNLGAEGFSTDLPQGIYTGYTIAYFALQIAIYLGFKKIFFLGLDLQNSGEKTHFFGHDHHSARHDETEFPKMLKTFEAAKLTLDELGIAVYNCSLASKLTVFPKMSFQQAISTS